MNIELASSTCAIKSTDFEYRKADRSAQEIHHKQWTQGMLRHVIAALQGARVVLITDNQTGHAVLGAKLIGFASTSNVRHGVLIEYPDGQRSVTHVSHLGESIIPLEQVGTQGAKWIALDSYRNEQTAARPLFLAKFDGQVPTGTGTWETRVTERGVVVSYQAKHQRELRNAEPEVFRGYTYREIPQAELGILA